MRVPKRVKTVEDAEAQQPVPVPAPAPTPAQPAKRGRGRPPRASTGTITSTATIPASAEKPAPATTTKRSTRRKPSLEALIEEVEEEGPKAAAAPKRTRRNAHDSADSFLDVLAEPTPAPQPKGRPPRKTRKQAAVVVATPAVQANQDARRDDITTVEPEEPRTQRKATRKAAKPTRKLSVPPEPISIPEPPPPPQIAPTPVAPPRPQLQQEPDPAPMDIDSTPSPAYNAQTQDPAYDESPAHAPARIALPISDTPVIDRNKEMRKKAATGGGAGTGGGRRSSLGMRGRRASSLIESGHTALPHRDVNSAEFYKHLAGDGGLPEPRRMKALLTWCGERALSEKPPLGSANPHAILGGECRLAKNLPSFLLLSLTV